MMVPRKYFISFLFSAFFFVALPQGKRSVDSLQLLLNKEQSDTGKVHILEKLSWAKKDTDPKAAVNDANEGLRLLELLVSSKKITENIYLSHKAALINTLGGLARYRGDSDEAIKYYLTSLKLFDGKQNDLATSSIYHNIATIYYSQRNFQESEKYFLLSKDSKEKLLAKNPQMIPLQVSLAKTYNNLGSIYATAKKYPLALEYYLKSLEIKKKQNDRQGMAKTMDNISFIYFDMKDISESRKYSDEAYRICLEDGLVYDRAGILISRASIERSVSNHSLAEEHYKEVIELSTQNGFYELLWVAYENYAKMLEFQGRNKESLTMIWKFITLRDSFNKAEIDKMNSDLVAKYQSEKKDKEISLLNEKNKSAALQAEKEQTQRYALMGGLALVIIFAGFIFNRFRVTQRQKAIIEHQKELMAEKQKEILDSIRYARRIQRSLLPTEKYIEKRLKSGGGSS
jgi:tetratricopeptide (TPR) repeat protein